MKYIRWAILFILILIVIVVIFGRSDGDKIISGTIRTDFITSTNEGCIEDLSENADASISGEAIASYCSCSSDKMAEMLTNSQVKEISRMGSIPVEIQERVTTATTPCREALLDSD